MKICNKRNANTTKKKKKEENNPENNMGNEQKKIKKYKLYWLCLY